jgi:hypothetical protein
MWVQQRKSDVAELGVEPCEHLLKRWTRIVFVDFRDPIVASRQANRILVERRRGYDNSREFRRIVWVAN